MTDLKYLFRALFVDGSEFVQPADDASRLLPTKSAFFDLLELSKAVPVSRFALLDSAGREALALDLTSGCFERGGLPLWCGEPPPPGAELRLIFFRRHVHEFTLGHEELSHSVRYFVGWQATVGRVNYKQTAGVD